ncbi:hypothetical protein, partial [Lactobacillus delbrueckii]|uniref:hypothetical protein n=1 Tax=Lactobacillus delbrueckii TaxID=1584 RepID=UPI003A8452B8
FNAIHLNSIGYVFEFGQQSCILIEKEKSTNSGQLIRLLAKHPLPKFGQLICQRPLIDTITE